MAHRIEIGLRQGVRDVRGGQTAESALKALGLHLARVVTRKAYAIDAELNAEEVESARRYFHDPVIETAAIGRLPPPEGFSWMIEVGFKPGVTDNVGRTALEALQDIVGRRLSDRARVCTSTQFFVTARNMRRENARNLAENLLANPLIQTIQIFSPAEWARTPVGGGTAALPTPGEPRVDAYDLSGSDDDLMRISRDRVLSLNLEEMKAIRDYFQRPETRAARKALNLPEQPTDVEVECVAQTWSEHCSHKVFAATIRYDDGHGRVETIHSLFKTYIKAATETIARSARWLVSVFTDNAGIIRFNKRLNLVYKVETHNSPSALDPYGGAMTGIVGVNRDPMGTGMGANLLCNVWGYCLGSPFYTGRLPAGLMHPRRTRDGVHQGVIEGGNQSGIPWMRGFEIFDDRYLGKPLVFCGTVGFIPVKIGGRPSERKEVLPGDMIVMLGGRIGKDGIHGATFSSEELREQSPVQAVQIGDPIIQRKMYEFLIEARDRGLYRCITDNGAGGLSCSVGEMGRISGGADLDLAKAPLKYEGLKPWEILLSEAQERMTLAVAPEHAAPLMELARKRDVEATVLGTFTDSSAFLIRYNERIVGRLDMDFLYDGCPVMQLEATWKPPKVPAPSPLRAGKRDFVLSGLLADLNLCSKEFKSRQYDGEVKGLSVVKPYVGVYSDMPADAAIMRVEYGRNEGIILAEGINPFYSDLDTYAMAASAIDEGVRRIISAGGRMEQIAGLDNFCWPDPVKSAKTPDGHYKLAQLVRANKALYDVTVAYGVPCISGKDSVKNDSSRGGRKISIPPTILFSTIAKMDDVRKAITMDVKRPGDLIYIIGLTRRELGASAFHRWLARKQGQPGHFGGRAPELNMPLALKIYRAMAKASARGLLRSSHTPTRGGLAVALAMSAMGGDLGIEADIGKAPAEEGLSDDDLLFSESNSRFVVTCKPGHGPALEKIFNGLPVARVGTVLKGRRIIVRGIRGRVVISAQLDRLRKAFKETLHGV